MISRCSNPNDSAYYNYGARGITVCDRWNTFENFLADMGDIPEGRSLDRIDNSQGYSPGNCRWATRSEQNQNTRRTLIYEFSGISLCQSEWAKKFGLTQSGFIKLIKKHGVQDAIQKLTEESANHGLSQ